MRYSDMLNSLRVLLVISFSFLSIACETYSEEKQQINHEPGALDLILCEEPRPQVCTREYDPVCAKLKDGEFRTASTGCTSCSDPEVVGYSKGACGIVSLD